jgi:hypothetical protein
MNTKKIRHAPTLFVFALFISFSCTAFGRSAHKCLGANGQYEYTDMKCPPVTSSAVTETSASASATASGGATHSDAAPANPAPLEAAPIQPQHETQPKQSVAPATGTPATSSL